MRNATLGPEGMRAVEHFTRLETLDVAGTQLATAWSPAAWGFKSTVKQLVLRRVGVDTVTQALPELWQQCAPASLLCCQG